MDILTSIAELRRTLHRVRGGTLGLVPTMGALHEGHMSLVRAAKAGCERVVATIFVNPLQFAPHEDFSRYPRTFEADCARLESEGVDVLFAPSREEMYPAGANTFIDVGELGERLDGASRPGHFRGVATVVSKLFHLVQPDRAFFGQKDAAQVAVLRAMVRDLNFNLELVVCPTVRDADGLALSSRNRYLSPREREVAAALPASLRRVEESVAHGERDVLRLRTVLVDDLAGTPGVRLDYAEIVDPLTLLPVESLGADALVAVAAWVGETRLIDNVILAEAAAEVKASR